MTASTRSRLLPALPALPAVLATSLLMLAVGHAGAATQTTRATHATPARFEAQRGDATVAQMVERWTTEDHRRIDWQAIYDLPLKDPKALNAATKLAHATSAADAVQRVVRFLNDTLPEMTPVHACVYTEGATAIVVRMVTDPCGNH